MPRRLGVVVAVVLVVTACSSGKSTHHATPTVPSTSSPGVSPPTAAAAGVQAPTAGAVDVRAHGARGDGTGDDTQAFVRAQEAAAASGVRFPNGPGGGPQAVVYVPPGTYRLIRLEFRPDLRMEVDAAAVLQQAGGRDVDVSSGPAALIQWDGPPGAALKNVTLIGVSSSSGGRKSVADPVFPGWSVEPDFTFDLDPATTEANELVAGIQALNVDGFLIQNVLSIQNDSQPAAAPNDKKDKAAWWPQTRRAALGLRSRNDTPADGSTFYDPHNGTISNWYNVHGPKGYGPNQINSGHNLSFQHLFSQGGTALRMETDAAQGKAFGSELRGVKADDIGAKDCNRAVAFSPHTQMNYDVHVSHVQAVGCSQGVIEAIAGPKGKAGAFKDSTIADVTVTGDPQAQNGKPGTDGLWLLGTSQKAFAKETTAWSVTYQAGTYNCKGSFQSGSDPIMTTDGVQTPTCT